MWTVQNIEQSIWTLSELLTSAKTAFEAGVELQIELYVSRGMAAPSPQTVDLLVKELPPPPHLEQRRSSMASEEWNNLSKESPIADALNIIGGRPAIDRIVPRFVANAEGKSLVVGQSASLRHDLSSTSSVLTLLSFSLFLSLWARIDGRGSSIRSHEAHRNLPRLARDRSLRMLDPPLLPTSSSSHHIRRVRTIVHTAATLSSITLFAFHPSHRRSFQSDFPSITPPPCSQTYLARL